VSGKSVIASVHPCRVHGRSARFWNLSSGQVALCIHDILISGPALSHLPVSLHPLKMTIDTYSGTRLQVSQPCSSSHAFLRARSDIWIRIFAPAISACGWAQTPFRWQQLEHVGAGASQCQSP